ncbi:hypothetical protein HDK77DRAFT_103093 [Phyllosticta capitalensis]|uniref:Uncharacterized protein n=1 Tax=Phyllosticta capitalensis TaxID=121624 RepID=A0ABR1YBE8_9PEZI
MPNVLRLTLGSVMLLRKISSGFSNCVASCSRSFWSTMVRSLGDQYRKTSTWQVKNWFSLRGKNTIASFSDFKRPLLEIVSVFAFRDTRDNEARRLPERGRALANSIDRLPVRALVAAAAHEHIHFDFLRHLDRRRKRLSALMPIERLMGQSEEVIRGKR